MDVLKAVPEKYRTSVEKTVRPIAIAALGMATTLGCKASELTAAMPDALYGAGSGFVGTMLIELELGEGRLVSYAMTKTKSCGLGLLSMGVFLAPPIVVSAVAAEHPGVGYAALAIPLVVGFMHLASRR
jgi:hypothetical protein